MLKFKVFNCLISAWCIHISLYLCLAATSTDPKAPPTQMFPTRRSAADTLGRRLDAKTSAASQSHTTDTAYKKVGHIPTFRISPYASTVRRFVSDMAMDDEMPAPRSNTQPLSDGTDKQTGPHTGSLETFSDPIFGPEGSSLHLHDLQQELKYFAGGINQPGPAKQGPKKRAPLRKGRRLGPAGQFGGIHLHARPVVLPHQELLREAAAQYEVHSQVQKEKWWWVR